MASGPELEVDDGVAQVAAAALRDAGERMGAVDLAAETARLAAALPGSRSAGAAAALGESWTRGTRGWARDAAAHGDGIAAVATTHRDLDTTDAARIRGALGG